MLSLKDISCLLQLFLQIQIQVCLEYELVSAFTRQVGALEEKEAGWSSLYSGKGSGAPPAGGPCQCADK